ncbi:MAG: phosphate ABC transporter permease PstA [Planctomycetaceae bacterium]
MSSDRGRSPRVRSPYAALVAEGEPWVWLTAGALALALAMILGLTGFIAREGLRTFWPVPLEEVQLADGTLLLGEQAGWERVVTDEAAGPVTAERLLLRTANQESGGSQFRWCDTVAIAARSRPPWAVAIERIDAGRLHGTPQRLLHHDRVVAEGAEEAWTGFVGAHPAIAAATRAMRRIDRVERGRLQRGLRAARLATAQARLDDGPESAGAVAAAAAEKRRAAELAVEEGDLDARTTALRDVGAGWVLECTTADGTTVPVPLSRITRAWTPNRLSWWGKLRVYLGRWGEFLGADPREANSAGGVFPAIWGTVAMTLIMALLVAPCGVLAALFLREYAGNGRATTAVRIAINNLAGVPSIVYGAFGLGFFCHVLGTRIDALFFEAALVTDGQPTFGTGGLLWASLTLALLTLPVVIVATEEALSSVPDSLREGSYACGAGKWQTIRRIVLPRALPGIMTGLILAMARGAGEVAPLMLVGVKKLALDLPIDGVFPFVHPEREFMHLAYLVYDVGFQSPDSQAARPLVFTITLLLVAIVAGLNLAAITLRTRLRRRHVVQQF